MQLELIPAVPELDPEGLRRALDAAGIRLESRRDVEVGAWARAARREAVDNQPAPIRQTLSPRSTRGATRA